MGRSGQCQWQRHRKLILVALSLSVKSVLSVAALIPTVSSGKDMGKDELPGRGPGEPTFELNRFQFSIAKRGQPASIRASSQIHQLNCRRTYEAVHPLSCTPGGSRA